MKNTLKIISSIALLALVGCSAKDEDVSAVVGRELPASTAAASITETGTTDEETYESMDIYAEEGVGTGYMDDTFHTYFFDFTITDGGFYETYGSLEPEEGNVFVELAMTIKNTTESGYTMFDYDFGLSYGEADEDLAYPVTDSGKQAVYDMFPTEYYLDAGQTKEGVLLFEIPEEAIGKNDITLLYLEQFEDTDESGDLFGVFISWPEEE